MRLFREYDRLCIGLVQYSPIVLIFILCDLAISL
jgi:hypothetical protein